MAGLLQKEYPGLRERFRRVLFDGPTRRRYLAGLRGRVERAMGRSSLTGLVEICL